MKQQVGYVSPELNFQPVGPRRQGHPVRARLLPDVGRGVLRPAADVAATSAPDERITTLSFGARIKLALVLALSWRPKLLILDEPTVGLDAISKQAGLRGAARRRSATASAPVLISSHGLTDIERFADHIGMIKNGRLLFEGATADVIERHRMVDFVAGRGRRVADRARCLRAGARREPLARAARSAARVDRLAARRRRHADHRRARDARRAVRRAGTGVTDACCSRWISCGGHTGGSRRSCSAGLSCDVVARRRTGERVGGIRIFHGDGVHGRSATACTQSWRRAPILLPADFEARHLASHLAARDPRARP